MCHRRSSFPPNLLLHFAIFFAILLIATGTIVDVKGILRCHNKTMSNATVELWEKDWVDPNDFLNRTVTARDGTFEIRGEESETFGIDPFLSILHNCAPDNTKSNCKYHNLIYLEILEQNGTMRKEDFEVNFGPGGVEASEENCEDSGAMAQELVAGGNETDGLVGKLKIVDQQHFNNASILPAGLSADLNTFAGINGTMEGMKKDEEGEEEEGGGAAFNLTSVKDDGKEMPAPY